MKRKENAIVTCNARCSLLTALNDRTNVLRIWLNLRSDFDGDGIIDAGETKTRKIFFGPTE